MTEEKIKPVLWVDADLDIHFGATHPEMTGNSWKPHYPESALAQAREEGRREGMREAAEICKKWGDDKVNRLSGNDELIDSAKASAWDALQCATAITRASEGNG